MTDETNPFQFSARDLMPDWAQERPEKKEIPLAKRFGQDQEREERRGGRDRRGGPGGFREGGRGGDRFQGRRDGGPREGGPRQGSPREGRDGARRDDRRPGGRRDDRPRDDRRSRDGGPRDGGPRSPREDAPPSGITAALEPAPRAIEGLSKHLRESFHVVALADLAKFILNGRDRYQVRFTAAEPVRLFRCPVDQSVWLSRDEAINHLLNSIALDQWYRVEDVEVEAPAGNYSVIAVCGMSGTLLGPPNHHEYQRIVARLHRERFSTMSLERFKSRIEMQSGEEVIEKWKAQVSRRRQYRVRSGTEEGQVDAPAAEPVAEEVPAPVEDEVEIAVEAGDEAELAEAPVEESAEAVASDEDPGETEAAAPMAEEKGEVITSIEELARHFRLNFAAEAIEEVHEAVVRGDIPGRCLNPGLLTLLKAEGDKARRGFPLAMIQSLCREFEKTGLKFFKRGKKSLHVSAVRPKAIDESVPFTDQVQRIVEYVRNDPKANLATMLASLDPDFKTSADHPPDQAIELTDASRAILKDLRWLTSEGYLLEFPDTTLAIGRPRSEAPAAQPAKEKPKKERKPKPEAAVTEVEPDAESASVADAPAEGGDEEADPQDPDPLPEITDPVDTV